ncbi:MAG: hypothetical protein KDI75_00905, partial [Xanthomonadales bacterium]|nr:hypothetical protein [Xanthomonadales bacterium]
WPSLKSNMVTDSRKELDRRSQTTRQQQSTSQRYDAIVIHATSDLESAADWPPLRRLVGARTRTEQEPSGHHGTDDRETDSFGQRKTRLAAGFGFELNLIVATALTPESYPTKLAGEVT